MIIIQITINIQEIDGGDYQSYLLFDNIINEGYAFLKNVYFKGGFDESAIMEYPPSGDFLYKSLLTL